MALTRPRRRALLAEFGELTNNRRLTQAAGDLQLWRSVMDCRRTRSIELLERPRNLSNDQLTDCLRRAVCLTARAVLLRYRRFQARRPRAQQHHGEAAAAPSESRKRTPLRRSRPSAAAAPPARASRRRQRRQPPARRSTYVEAVALYERARGAAAPRLSRARSTCFESVLRQYPGGEGAARARAALPEHLRAPGDAAGRRRRRRVDERLYAATLAINGGRLRRGASRTCAWSATRIPTTTTRSTCWRSRTRSAASTPKPSRTSSAPSRSTPRTARSRDTIPTSSRSATTTRSAPRSKHRRRAAPTAGRSDRRPLIASADIAAR